MLPYCLRRNAPAVSPHKASAIVSATASCREGFPGGGAQHNDHSNALGTGNNKSLNQAVNSPKASRRLRSPFMLLCVNKGFLSSAANEATYDLALGIPQAAQISVFYLSFTPSPGTLNASVPGEQPRSAQQSCSGVSSH